MVTLNPILEPVADGIANSLRGVLCADSNLLQRLAGILIYPEQVTDPSIRPALELLAPRSCPPRGGTPTPVRGGQCDGVLYRVPFTRIAPDGSTLSSEFQNVVGPITAVAPLWQPDGFGNLRYFVRILCPNDNEDGGERKFGPSGYIDSDRASRTVLGPISRMDGTPDTCGDGPLLPPVDPQPWPTITLPPITIDVGGVDVDFNVDVDIRPTINLPDFGGIHIPVSLTFAPNIVLAGGLVTVAYFRLPNLELNFPISFQWEVNNIINLPGAQRPCPPPADECDCEDIRQIVREEIDLKFPPRRPFAGVVTNVGELSSGEIPLPPFTRRVDVNLVQIPTNAKTQSGGNASDVFYAGWYAFGFGPSQGDRRPISYQNNSFICPPGAQNFAFTLQAGYTGTVTVFYDQELD